MDAAQWAKDVRNDGSYNNNQVQDDKKANNKPQHEHALNCPRCNSTNTKFCYYNNYSLTQPRYFCKACKRYWTKGGSLRSVPVGGGSRKNKRSSSVSSTSSMSKPIDLSQFSSPNFNAHDLNLGSRVTQEVEYHHHGFSQFLKLPKIENNANNNNNNNATYLSSSNGLMMMNTDPTNNVNNTAMMFNNNGARFTLQDFKPTMSTTTFPFQGNGIKYGNLQNNQEDGERPVMLPFGVLMSQQQQHPPIRDLDQSMAQGNSNAYWNATMGEGSSTLYN